MFRQAVLLLCATLVAAKEAAECVDGKMFSHELCPASAPLMGFGGAAVALVFACLGSAYGTGKAGSGISFIGVNNPGLVMKAIIPVVMAGVLGIYGLIIAVIIGNSIMPYEIEGHVVKNGYSAFNGYSHLASGLACGFSGMAAGIAIGIVGDAGVRGVAQQPKLYVGMVLILIFAEALGLYGLIIGLILSSHHSGCEIACTTQIPGDVKFGTEGTF